MHARRNRRKKRYTRRISPRQRRNRRILAAAFAAVLMILFLTSFFIRPAKPHVWYAYEVEPGDTIWTICRKEYGEGDIRRAVDLIVRENGISGSRIYPGERLVLPVCE